MHDWPAPTTLTFRFRAMTWWWFPMDFAAIVKRGLTSISKPWKEQKPERQQKENKRRGGHLNSQDAFRDIGFIHRTHPYTTVSIRERNQQAEWCEKRMATFETLVSATSKYVSNRSKMCKNLAGLVFRSFLNTILEVQKMTQRRCGPIWAFHGTDSTMPLESL